MRLKRVRGEVGEEPGRLESSGCRVLLLLLLTVAHRLKRPGRQKSTLGPGWPVGGHPDDAVGVEETRRGPGEESEGREQIGRGGLETGLLTGGGGDRCRLGRGRLGGAARVVVVVLARGLVVVGRTPVGPVSLGVELGLRGGRAAGLVAGAAGQEPTYAEGVTPGRGRGRRRRGLKVVVTVSGGGGRWWRRRRVRALVAVPTLTAAAPGVRVVDVDLLRGVDLAAATVVRHFFLTNFALFFLFKNFRLLTTLHHCVYLRSQSDT